MNKFYPGQKLKASDLNEIVAENGNHLILSTKDQKIINTRNGTHYQDFFNTSPQNITTAKPLDISIQYGTDGKEYVWMYVNNTLSSNTILNGYPYCKYNGEYIRGIVGINSGSGGGIEESWSILQPGEALHGYEAGKVERGANGLGWWYTGLGKTVNTSSSNSGLWDIIGYIADVQNPSSKNIFKILIVTYRLCDGSLTDDYLADLSITILGSEYKLLGIHNLGEPFTIAQVQNDKQTYSSDQNSLSVSVSWQYSQVINDIDFKTGYEPWEMIPEQIGGQVRAQAQANEKIQFWRPIYVVDDKLHTIDNKLLLDTGKKLDDVKTNGLAFYVVHERDAQTASLSVQEWMYYGDEITEQMLPEKLSAFCDGKTEAQLVCWVNTFGTQYFTRYPSFQTGTNKILVDSDVSALHLSSLQELADISSIAPDISADPKLSAADKCYEIFGFSDLSSQYSEVSELENDYSKGQHLILRGLADGEKTEVTYLDLSAVTVSCDTDFSLLQQQSVQWRKQQIEGKDQKFLQLNQFDNGAGDYTLQELSAHKDDLDVLIRDRQSGRILKYANVAHFLNGGSPGPSPVSTDIDVITDIEFEFDDIHKTLKANLTKQTVTILATGDIEVDEVTVQQFDTLSTAHDINYNTTTHKCTYTAQEVYAIAGQQIDTVEVFEATPHRNAIT